MIRCRFGTSRLLPLKASTSIPEHARERKYSEKGITLPNAVVIVVCFSATAWSLSTCTRQQVPPFLTPSQSIFGCPEPTPIPIITSAVPATLLASVRANLNCRLNTPIRAFAEDFIQGTQKWTGTTKTLRLRYIQIKWPDETRTVPFKVRLKTLELILTSYRKARASVGA